MKPVNTHTHTHNQCKAASVVQCMSSVYLWAINLTSISSVPYPSQTELPTSNWTDPLPGNKYNNDEEWEVTLHWHESNQSTDYPYLKLLLDLRSESTRFEWLLALQEKNTAPCSQLYSYGNFPPYAHRASKCRAFVLPSCISGNPGSLWRFYFTEHLLRYYYRRPLSFTIIPHLAM